MFYLSFRINECTKGAERCHFSEATIIVGVAIVIKIVPLQWKHHAMLLLYLTR